jgi:plasmid stabilization system protein ParE
MAFTINWSLNAEQDILDIVGYIKEKSGKNAAAKIYERIKTRALSLTDFPEIGRIVPEFAQIGIMDIRQLNENPWRLYYRVVAEDVWILAVIDTRRDLEEILYTKIIKGKRV